MGEGVPPMFTFRDPDGNRFRMVERPSETPGRAAAARSAVGGSLPHGGG